MDSQDPSAASSGTNRSSSHQQYRFGPDDFKKYMTPEEWERILQYEASFGSGGPSIQPSGFGDSLERSSCVQDHGTNSGGDEGSDQLGSVHEPGCICGGPDCESPPQTWEEFRERKCEFRNAPFSELPSQPCHNLLGYIATKTTEADWEGALEVDKAYQACLKGHEDLEHVMWGLREVWREDYFYKGAGNETIKKSFSDTRAIWEKEVEPKNQEWLEDGDPPGTARIARLGELKLSLETVEKWLINEAQNLKALKKLELTS